jgi:hypothetical protein
VLCNYRLKRISIQQNKNKNKNVNQIVTKRFGTNFTEVDRGGGHQSVFFGYLIFEFRCTCASTAINCTCIKKKKELGRKTKEKFVLMGIPEYRNHIVYDL